MSTARPSFNEVYKTAYGWTIDRDGTLCGLVAGDQGYEWTDISLTKLVEQALEETGGADEILNKLGELVDACHAAIGTPATPTDTNEKAPTP